MIGEGEIIKFCFFRFASFSISFVNKYCEPYIPTTFTVFSISVIFDSKFKKPRAPKEDKSCGDISEVCLVVFSKIKSIALKTSSVTVAFISSSTMSEHLFAIDKYSYAVL